MNPAAVQAFLAEVRRGSQPWVEHAACRGAGPALWYPDRGEPAGPGKAVCAACPVAAACAEYAIHSNEKYGLWGGLTVQDRSRIRRARGLTMAAAHRGECPHGHPYTPENTYITPTGHRRCRQCARTKRAKRQAS